MYGYDEYSDITADQIIQKVSQEQIFEWLLGKKFNIDEKYTAPYREDRTPRCWFEYKEGVLLFMDFGDREGRRHKPWFLVVMAMYKVGYQSAMDIVCSHFKISKNSTDYKPVEKVLYEKVDKLPAIIKPEHQIYTRKDKIYWNQFIISLDNLEEDNVFSVSRFFLDSKKGRRWITPYNICYDIDFIDAHKIYQPYNNPLYRWITNCDEDHIGNIDNLPSNGNKLFIQKAYKDHRVMRNLQKEYNVIWFQNEGSIPSISILTNLTTRFDEIIVFFDNDLAGVTAAIKTVSIFNNIKPGCARTVVLSANLPKNVSDLVHKEGRSDTLKILDKMKLL